jgi:CHAD domain-containing protein
VLTARVDSQLGRVEADDAFQGIIARVLQDRRARARELLVPALLSERYAALLALMSAPAGGRGGGESAESFARRRIGRALAKIAQWTRQDPEKLTAEQMHRLRILFKRLRYTVEFFRSILGQGAALLARECVAYQDCLGLHQDARVAAGVLARLADEPVVREQKDGLLTLGALVQVQREMMRLQRERFRTLWGTVESLFDLWNAPPAKVRP